MTLTKKQAVGIGILATYIGTIVAANYVVQRFGIVPVGFGLMGPAAVYLVGVSFTLRDLIQDSLGREWVIFGIVTGAAVSYAVASPALAAASALAFGLSELADMAIYTPLRRRSWLGAIALSNTVGLLVDSVVFLWLAFGSLAFLPGQLIGKAWMTLLFVAVIALSRLAVRRRLAVTR